MAWWGPTCPRHPAKEIKKAADLTDWVRGSAPGSLQLGSGRTLGHGIVRVRWTGKKPAKTARKSPAKKIELGRFEVPCKQYRVSNRRAMTDFESAILKVSQQRAAREALAEGGRQPYILQNYLAVVRQLPKLLSGTAWGRALACLELRAEGRPNSVYTFLGRQLDRWLLTNLGVSDRTALAALSSRDSQFYREASELAWHVRALALRSGQGGAMSWPWRMPRDLPGRRPIPLPRDTSEAVLAEGRCDNFGLLMERYLAFGDNRGRLQLLRELTDRRALVPDFSGLQELIAAHDARWQQTAGELGAITFSARPHGA